MRYSLIADASNGHRMGRYKDYREPKRRGYGDDNSFGDGPIGDRPNYPSPSASQASAPVDSVVKWFNAEKGFGFVTLPGGSEAFLHIRQLERAGHKSVPEGARLKVRTGQGQKGPEVTEVLDLDLSTARSSSSSSSAERRAAAPSQAAGQSKVGTGTVKMYKTDTGFGFVGQDDGGKDVFVHATVLARAGLKGLTEGQRVRMQIAQGQKGLEAQTIELLD